MGRRKRERERVLRDENWSVNEIEGGCCGCWEPWLKRCSKNAREGVRRRSDRTTRRRNEERDEVDLICSWVRFCNWLGRCDSGEIERDGEEGERWYLSQRNLAIVSFPLCFSHRDVRRRDKTREFQSEGYIAKRVRKPQTKKKTKTFYENDLALRYWNERC